ncbi:MAG: UPF0175 family protein [Bacteroidales bacterium]|nr:UPF0175 family protein [Bacteroidales bacterium]MCF8351063.1 UPF0175 family protein [Bacteroidales bacterium]MCF8375871.1 UPF0175 family protein [Bacteroidales bacterium]
MSYRITLEIPDKAFSILRNRPDKFARELLEAALCKWYEQGKISQSKAAEIAEISRYEFLEILKKHDVNPFQYTPSDLDAEVNL